MKILVINGPNLNMLGIREPDHYGKETYADLCGKIQKYCENIGVDVKIYQSNHEGDLVDKIQEAYDNIDGIVINPGAYTHYSYAIRDAISAIKIPVFEVHMSDIYKREEFRHKSVIHEVCVGQIVGKGKDSYLLAVDEMDKIIKD